ncbi:N-acetylglucosamine-6-phosphate deacetylase [uncultured Shimia sp.]|uniref:N-acetylglucosamine-6-phosphate deacetylase n=1 Tax=uncultured Shimia sp. TaxID=573152 RepID=UPI0025DCF103|nr:N-acetylglucosamine-6-phosphate deacetylase [uncultured Shimia sp.]
MVDPKLCSFVFADALYDGTSPNSKPNSLICISEKQITAVHEGVSPNDVPRDAICVPVAMPGFIDLQINGAGDVQFNFDVSVAGLETLVAASAHGGATHIFPTFTTAPDSGFVEALEVVTQAVASGVPGVAGIHLEGPFISPARPGIHRSDFIRPLTKTDADVLCEAAKSITILLTLAPEEQDPQLLRQLSDSGIKLFAGHTEASAEDMDLASRSGVVGVTHLFNAMRQSIARDPGVVGAVLGSGDFFAGLIADGYHVHPRNLNLAVRSIPEQLCLVTDAMQTMNGNSKEMMLYGKRIVLENGRLNGEDGTIGGAHLTMNEAVRNITQMTEATLGDAAVFASTNPARAVGVHHTYGQIAAGFNASITMLDGDLNSVGVVRDGVYQCLEQTA